MWCVCDDVRTTQLRPPNTPSLFSSALVSGFSRRAEAHIPNKWKCTHAHGGEMVTFRISSEHGRQACAQKAVGARGIRRPLGGIRSLPV